MAHLIQVGAGSGGMAVLDPVIRDPRITELTLIEPDGFHADNVGRHLFGHAAIDKPKARLAADWVRDHRPDVRVQTLECDIVHPLMLQEKLEAAAASADIGICAVDNETAKFAWDELMRRHAKSWTLGEVLSGGIGGFVHWFSAGGPCYGCVASHLQRSVQISDGKAPDYSHPDGGMAEARIPASRAAISAIASLHALVTLDLLAADSDYAPGFTSLLLSLKGVPGVFAEPFHPFRFQIPKATDCLICGHDSGNLIGENLDVALDDALARLGHA